MKLQTKSALKRNREVTISYLDPLSTTQLRQRATRERWGFACECPRCADPTEFGTCASGIRDGNKFNVGEGGKQMEFWKSHM